MKQKRIRWSKQEGGVEGSVKAIMVDIDFNSLSGCAKALIPIDGPERKQIYFFRPRSEIFFRSVEPVLITNSLGEHSLRNPILFRFH